MLKKMVSAFCLLTASTLSYAAFLPVGVLNDVSYDKVTKDWGWTLINESDYGGGLSIADLFKNHGTHVMIGAMRKDSGIIDVIAGAAYTDVTTYTALNTTHSANSVEWYFNGYSMGFAGSGDTIFQNQADANGLDERDRLSWHTSKVIDDWVFDDTSSPGFVFNGWRSGSNIDLKGIDAVDWTRVVFTDSVTPNVVPEPATLALLGMGLAGLGFKRRRKA